MKIINVSSTIVILVQILIYSTLDQCENEVQFHLVICINNNVFEISTKYIFYSNNIHNGGVSIHV